MSLSPDFNLRLATIPRRHARIRVCEKLVVVGREGRPARVWIAPIVRRGADFHDRVAAAVLGIVGKVEVQHRRRR
jgi:hypothetical protein